MKHVYIFRRGLLLLALLTTGGLTARAQNGVGIGTTAPDASAALDIVATTKGALLPRVASTGSVPSPATGLIVFQTGAPAGYYYNAGTPGAPSWQQIATASGAAITASNGLTKTGQNVALGGTLTGATTIAQGSNNFSLTGGSVGIGTATPGTTLDVSGSFNVGISGTAQQISQLGQNNTISNGTNTIGQSFTMPTAGTITSFALNFVAATTSTVTFYQGAGNGGTVLGAQTATFAANTLQTVTLTTPIAVAAGVYTMVLSPTNNYFSTANPYAGGQITNGTNLASFAAFDLVFTVNYSTPSSTSLYASTGSVGIGTATPSAVLDVNGSTRLRGLSTAGLVQTDASGNLSSASTASFGTSFIQNQNAADQAASFRIASTGSVGSLQAIGASAAVQTIGTQGAFLQWNRSGADGETWLLNQQGLGTTNAGIRFGGATTGNVVTEWARFLNNGNFGIGIAAPSALLDVNGSTRLRGLTTAGLVTTDASGNLGSASAASFGTSFIQNTTTQQATSNFNISGAGTVGGLLTANSATVTGNIQSSANIAVDAGNANTGTVANTLRFGPTNSGEAIGSKRTSGGNQFGLDFYTTSTNRMSITAGGNVGIGTSTPQNLLDLGESFGNSFTDAATRKLGVFNTPTGSIFYGLGVTSGYMHLFADAAPGANPKMSISGSGNVGIGVPIPSALLDVAGSTRLRGLSTAGLVTTDASGNLSSASTASFGTSFIQNQNAADQTGNFRIAGTGSVGSLQANNNSAIGTQGAFLQWNRTNGDGETWLLNQKGGGNTNAGIRFGSVTTLNAITEWGRFLDNGNFGIGTTAPTTQFANTNLNIVGTDANGISTQSLNWLSTTNGYAGAFYSSNNTTSGNGLAVKVLNTGAVALDVSQGATAGTAGTSLLRVNGNGTVSTSSTLTTGGEVRAQNANNRLRRANTPQAFTDTFDPVGNPLGVHISNNEAEEGGFWANGNYAAIYSPGDNDLVKFMDEDGFDNVGTVYDGTALRARIDGGGQYFQVSDANAKHDIQPIADGLRKLTSLSGYTYAFNLLPKEVKKGQKALMAAGVLAQEVEKVLPEAVSQENGHYMVNYAALAPLFIQAIKEQQTQIETLKAQHAADHASLMTLQAQMARLLDQTAPVGAQPRK